jgi:hypothetical protein
MTVWLIVTGQCIGDIVFVIDNSDAVDGPFNGQQSALNFGKIKNFIINFIESVSINADLVRVSVVTYADSGNVCSHLIHIYFDILSFWLCSSLLFGPRVIMVEFILQFPVMKWLRLIMSEQQTVYYV